MKKKHKTREKKERPIETLNAAEEKSSISQSSKKKEDQKGQIAILEEKLKQAESESLYLRAEFENFKKKSLEEKFKAFRYEGEKFISSLATEVLDDLDRALLAGRDNKSLEDLQKGLEIIHKKVGRLLEQFGVKVLDPTGKAFDPSYQEALNFVKDSKIQEDYVVETYKKAYKMHDKVIRPAQVIVAKSEK